ncbi:MAG: dehydrogenase [Chitinophagales bacterium]|nr:dehydrogenase [Chitinophagales bacterium]MCZ2393864.1 dehydrogenase [Chitinophagales bacterium]
MIIRSKAPLRIGLAGGGTDVSPFSDIYGGAILNVTITLYAYATIRPTNDNKITINAIDRNTQIVLDSKEQLEIDGYLDLVKGVYNRIVKDFVKEKLSFEISTYVDAPPGSGLGSSSTLVVAILGAFVEWLKLPLGEYDIAHLAYKIEREDLKMAGGKQDQYAATFGGVNYMEFYDHNKVIVNPLRVKNEFLNELEHNLILFYTETSRLSSEIIQEQTDNVVSKKEKSIEAMLQLKQQSVLMKEAILKGSIDDVGKILHDGWQYKKQMADKISNEQIDKIYQLAMENGATGGKISGAGGGGFMIFYAPYILKYDLIKSLNQLGGKVLNYNITNQGLTTWTIF